MKNSTLKHFCWQPIANFQWNSSKEFFFLARNKKSFMLGVGLGLSLAICWTCAIVIHQTKKIPQLEKKEIFREKLYFSDLFTENQIKADIRSRFFALTLVLSLFFGDGLYGRGDYSKQIQRRERMKKL